MIYVVAGNRDQFLNWCKVNGIDPHYDARYVSEPRDLFGIYKGEFVLYGTFYERRNWRDLERQIESQMARHPQTFVGWVPKGQVDESVDEALRKYIRDSQAQARDANVRAATSPLRPGRHARRRIAASKRRSGAAS